MKIIFVHGWGADASYWNALAAHLPADIDAQRVDLGYGAAPITTPDDTPALYITHSLGTMWALKNRCTSMIGLIAINGFACFNAFTDKRVLQAMEKGLSRNPQRQMNAFYNSANMPQQERLNPENLAQGLGWLKHWDCREILQSLTCPVMALAGGCDAIVPLAAAQEAWQGRALNIVEEGGHNLPQTHSAYCAEKVREMINI